VADEQYCLTPMRPDDAQTLVCHLTDRAIYAQTLRIPFPYTLADAQRWLSLVDESTRRHGRPVHWAIRDERGLLIGGCGLNDLDPDRPHRAEIGYWLARPYWGRGIMTAMVGAACRRAFSELGLSKLVACVFAANGASLRVLEKNDFEREGYLKKHFLKDGRLIDAVLLARLNG
jgi:RimJ/RimL family protein N-acetyltransferase